MRDEKGEDTQNSVCSIVCFCLIAIWSDKKTPVMASRPKMSEFLGLKIIHFPPRDYGSSRVQVKVDSKQRRKWA